MGTGRHYLVVGGGAGGIELAIRLADHRGADRVTLVDRRPVHLWKPRLHEIAAGLLEPSEEQANFGALAARHGFDFVLGGLAGLDPIAHRASIAGVPYPSRLKIADGAMLSTDRTLDYDVAVVAIGSTGNSFGTPGVEAHSYALDGGDGAVQLHLAFLAEAMRVQIGEADRVRIVIAGAGTTGVELAAELRHAAVRLAAEDAIPDDSLVDITIVDMADRPLPGSATETSDYVRHMLAEHRVTLLLDHKIASVDRDGVTCADGTHLPASIVVWATGIEGVDAMRTIAGARIGRTGRGATDDRLRLLDEQGGALPDLYAMGDCVEAPTADGGTVPATAQAAHQQALYLAGALRSDDPKAFRYRYRGTLVSLGGTAAVGDVPLRARSLSIHGLGARLGYAWLYRSHQAELSGWPRVAGKVAAGWLRRSTAPAAKLHW